MSEPARPNLPRVRKTLLNGCINKVVYRSQREAQQACDRMKTRQITLRFYRCPECRNYHVTSRNK